MKAYGWNVAEFGGPETMQWCEMPLPVPGRGQLRVRVHASGHIPVRNSPS
jgi:NADPH:quinone reductase-like Zn-dependent oxidoreductase